MLTPHSTTGRSPAELLLGRKPRSHLDFIFPSKERHVTQNQERQKENHDMHTRQRSFQVGEEVYALNHRGMPKWIPGKVTAVLGPLTPIVMLDDGTETRYHVHVDHVKERIAGEEREHFSSQNWTLCQPFSQWQTDKLNYHRHQPLPPQKSSRILTL